MADVPRSIVSKFFEIPESHWPDEAEFFGSIAAQIHFGHGCSGDASAGARWSMPAEFVEALVFIAIDVWRVQGAMRDRATGKVREDMRRSSRHIASVLDTLVRLGVEVKDHTGDVFEYGLSLVVIASEPTRGIVNVCVSETIKPTVYLHGEIIQMGEVVVSTPWVEDEAQ